MDKLTKLIAEKVMGWRPMKYSDGTEAKSIYVDRDGACKDMHAFNPREDMNDAMEVFVAADLASIERDIDCKGSYWEVSHTDDVGTTTYIYDYNAELPCLAICLAALKAKGVDVSRWEVEPCPGN